jgi:hypothetical protein
MPLAKIEPSSVAKEGGDRMSRNHRAGRISPGATVEAPTYQRVYEDTLGRSELTNEAKNPNVYEVL